MITTVRVDLSLQEGDNPVLKVSGTVKLVGVYFQSTNESYPRLNIQLSGKSFFDNLNTERSTTGIEPKFLNDYALDGDTCKFPKVIQYDTIVDKYAVLYEPLPPLVGENLYIYLHANSSVVGNSAVAICVYEEIP